MGLNLTGRGFSLLPPVESPQIMTWYHFTRSGSTRQSGLERKKETGVSMMILYFLLRNNNRSVLPFVWRGVDAFPGLATAQAAAAAAVFTRWRRAMTSCMFIHLFCAARTTRTRVLGCLVGEWGGVKKKKSGRSVTYGACSFRVLFRGCFKLWFGHAERCSLRFFGMQACQNQVTTCGSSHRILRGLE